MKFFAAGALASALLFGAPAQAQAQLQAQEQAQVQAQVQAQAQAQTPEILPVVPIDPFAPGTLIDFREQMRLFIQNISTFGRTFNPTFVVIVEDGLELVTKPDPEDDTRLFPARAYMRAIDGVLEAGLLDETITTPEGKPDPTLEAKVKLRGENIAAAQASGLSVFDMETATDIATIDKMYTDSTRKGYVPFVGETPQLGTVPKHPATAFSANPRSITDPAQASNFLYIANSQGFGDVRDFVGALRTTNHDIVVVDVFHGREPLTRQDVEWLKYKRLGARRLVLAEINISSAAMFHYYWQAGWGQGNPPFILMPVREDPDRNRTAYWDAGWQAIIAGDFNSYVYGVIDLGFDGVVLKGTDAWRFFETGGEEQ